jgi:NADH dehydrogenase
MILVTGANGFIGSHLLPKLHQRGYPIRVLLQPEGNAYQIPKNIPVEVAICGINDEHNLNAALKSVDTIIHLASDETRGHYADLETVDIRGTRTLLRVCEKSSVKRIILVSHIGAEPASAFPILKVKGIVEQAIINSHIDYTILKTGPVFGKGDHFINKIRQYIKAIPFFTVLPDKGKAVLHPIWVGDLVTSLIYTLENPLTNNQIIAIGGPGYYTLKEIHDLLLSNSKLKRLLFFLPSSTLRLMLLFLQVFYKNLPVSSFDIDILAADHTAPIDNITKIFGILPYSFQDYLNQ